MAVKLNHRRILHNEVKVYTILQKSFKRQLQFLLDNYAELYTKYPGKVMKEYNYLNQPVPNIYAWEKWRQTDVSSEPLDWFWREMWVYEAIENVKPQVSKTVAKWYKKSYRVNEQLMLENAIIYNQNLPIAYMEDFGALNLSNFKGSISKTTKMWVIDILKNWIDNDLWVWDIKKQIVALDSKLFSKARAQMIAVTEMGKAYEHWNYLPIKQLQQWWVAMLKQWSTVGDSRVRPTHMDNETVWRVPLDYTYSSTGTNLAPTGVNCFIENTDIYTNKWWKRFEDIKDDYKDLEFWSLNPETQYPEWVKAISYLKIKHNDYTYIYDNKNIQLWNTLNHNQYIQERRQTKDKEHYWTKRELKEDKDIKWEYRMYRWCNWDWDNIDNMFGINWDVRCEFMWYYLSEWSTSNPKRWTKQIKISQCSIKNPDKYRKMLNCCEQMWYKIWKWKEAIYLVDYEWQLYDYLKQFGKSYEKYTPTEIKEATKEQIEIYLSAYLLWDWHINSWWLWEWNRLWFTSSDKMAWDIMECIMKIWWWVSYWHQEPKTIQHKNWLYKTKHSCWIIRELKTKTISCSTYTDKTRKKELYNWYVYDVELEKNHVLFVRYNNKVMRSGNCRCTMLYEVRH